MEEGQTTQWPKEKGQNICQDLQNWHYCFL